MLVSAAASEGGQEGAAFKTCDQITCKQHRLDVFTRYNNFINHQYIVLCLSAQASSASSFVLAIASV